MQDSKAIFSNLLYQFFGKVNNLDTAKYYERLLGLIKKETTSVNKVHNLNFDTRITTGEKEVSKRRADIFFRLKQGEFIAFADGVDKRVRFRLQKITKQRQSYKIRYSKHQLAINYKKIHSKNLNTLLFLSTIKHSLTMFL